MEQKSAADQLNKLLNCHYTEIKYFEYAEKHVHDESLKPFLHNSAEERHRFTNEILKMLHEIGATPDKGNSKELTYTDDISTLENCGLNDEKVLKEYHYAMSNPNLSSEMREKLSEHLHLIRNGKEQLSKLEITL